MSGHSNTTAEQRARILERLRQSPMSTLHARAQLDVMHPAARVMELRKAGYCCDPCADVCTPVHTAKEVILFRRVARYVLAPTGDGYTLPLPFQTPRDHSDKGAM